MNITRVYTSGILLLTICLLSMISCSDDFLTQPPRAALTVGSFPASEQDAVLATNAIYNITRTWQISTGGFPLLDMMADDAVKGSNPTDGIVISVYDKFEHTSSEGSTERWYKTLYEAVRRTNLVINEVPSIEMDAELQDRLVAEARYLRAYFYADLVRGFGAVPMVTVTEPSLELGRTEVTTILSEIIYPDLEFAVSILPERSEYPAEELGRATRGAALSLLARIKLHYGEYEDVRDLTEQVVSSGEYDLVPDYADVFVSINEHNEEAIFEISALPENFNDGGNQYGNTQGVRGTPNKGWGFCRPAYVWIEELQNNSDPRLEPTVLFLNETIDGITIRGDGSTPDTTRESGRIVEIECYNQKVWYPGTDSRESFGHNRRIIRYADVLLMHAEALNELGQSAAALPFLNRVRERARGGDSNILPDITTTDQSDLRAAIAEERYYELALEGSRFWDLVRTDRAEEVLGPLGFIRGKHELFPIPQSEIDISEGRIDQNPGY